MNKRLWTISVVVLIILLAQEAGAGTYSGGNGRRGTPYQIGNVADWNTLSTTPGDWGKYFVVIADIDFAGASLTPVGNSPTYFDGNLNGDGHVLRNYQIIDTPTSYQALFAELGENGVINNLGLESFSITGESYLGGMVGENHGTITSCYAAGTISGSGGGLVFMNVGTITSCYATGAISSGGGLVYLNFSTGTITSSYATVTINAGGGGLVLNNEGTITSCYATGNIIGPGGGLVYSNSGTITSCYASGQVNAYALAEGGSGGGLVGSNYGEVILCHATGAVTGTVNIDYLGGLVGENLNVSSKITSCYATGQVIGYGKYAGGLVGYNTGDLTLCYATGAVEGHTSVDTGFVGGLVGLSSDGIITSCYARGAVLFTNSWAGGLLGATASEISYCYSTGRVEPQGSPDPNAKYGGLVGHSAPPITRVFFSYWDMETSGLSESEGGEGRTTDDMTHPCAANTYVDWDFSTVWAEDTILSFNNGYPYLQSNVPVRYSGGAGTAADPFQIKNVSDWTSLSTTPADWDYYFVIVADIDFEGAALTPVGNWNTKFTGVLDGKGHILSNGKINYPDLSNVGLFGVLGTASEIRDLDVENIGVTGKSDVGGLVGCNAGTIQSCYTSGAISGSMVGGLVGLLNEGGSISGCFASCAVTGDYGGGLVGGIDTGGTVTTCYATGPVKGDECNGGLVGWKSNGTSSITACFATNSVMGNSFVGGLVGYDQHGSITACFAAGSVTGTTAVGGLVGLCGSGMIESCYWDTASSGQATSCVGEGRTTEEMTYPYAANTFVGWDFSTVWDEDRTHFMNQGYPYLREYVAPEEGEGEPPVPLMADLNEDFRMVMGEAIAYLAGWQQGSNPMAYAIRATYLWQNGEGYVYDASEEPPMCWVLASPD